MKLVGDKFSIEQTPWKDIFCTTAGQCTFSLAWGDNHIESISSFRNKLHWLESDFVAALLLLFQQASIRTVVERLFQKYFWNMLPEYAATILRAAAPAADPGQCITFLANLVPTFYGCLGELFTRRTYETDMGVPGFREFQFSSSFNRWKGWNRCRSPKGLDLWGEGDVQEVAF